MTPSCKSSKFYRVYVRDVVMNCVQSCQGSQFLFIIE